MYQIFHIIHVNSSVSYWVLSVFLCRVSPLHSISARYCLNRSSSLSRIRQVKYKLRATPSLEHRKSGALLQQQRTLLMQIVFTIWKDAGYIQTCIEFQTSRNLILSLIVFLGASISSLRALVRYL